MKNSQSRLQLRSRAKRRLADIADNQDNILVIHYSCESFRDRPNGASPRITSIAVRNIETANTVSFSIHKMAERKGLLNAQDIRSNYDELEKEMLDEFYTFLGKHQNFSWVHWNMRDANYGFPAIEHRFSVLGGKPEPIKEEKLFDLGKSMKDLYGSNYADHPRLDSLRRLNEISDLDFLDGEAEAKAFDQGDFHKLHMSTLRKVDILASIFELTASGSLKTKAKKKEIYGSRFAYAVGIIREHWVFTIIGLVSAIVGIIGFILYLKDNS